MRRLVLWAGCAIPVSLLVGLVLGFVAAGTGGLPWWISIVAVLAVMGVAWLWAHSIDA